MGYLPFILEYGIFVQNLFWDLIFEKKKKIRDTEYLGSFIIGYGILGSPLNKPPPLLNAIQSLAISSDFGITQSAEALWQTERVVVTGLLTNFNANKQTNKQTKKSNEYRTSQPNE